MSVCSFGESLVLKISEAICEIVAICFSDLVDERSERRAIICIGEFNAKCHANI